MNHDRTLVALAAVALAVTACGGGTPGYGTPAAKSSPTPSVTTPVASGPVIHIKGFAFGLPSTGVTAGEKVTVVNDDSAAHTLSDKGGAFDTGSIDPGGSATFVAPKAGTYQLICAFHPRMRGTLVVR